MLSTLRPRSTCFPVEKGREKGRLEVVASVKVRRVRDAFFDNSEHVLFLSGCVKRQGLTLSLVATGNQGRASIRRCNTTSTPYGLESSSSWLDFDR